MLRVETADGWYLITHPDHARLAAELASHWGNALFTAPHPRAEVLHGIAVHDDGWASRDAHPAITRAGKPVAFSHELVGRYSAFEEIDLADYLAVRESAVVKVEADSTYAALLVSMHTYNLLSERADRTTIAPEQLPLLDAFLARQKARQSYLEDKLKLDPAYFDGRTFDEAVLNNFRLLQATDNLSLLGCVGFTRPATLLHPLATNAGGTQTVDVIPLAPRALQLIPYPLNEERLTFSVPARHVRGRTFAESKDLESAYQGAAIDRLEITITA